ncbi:hypothetical protein [Nonomuraea candida]|uniref:hypothetical protein n=1 Tax=Nonomuraea candida TaxID=359159 RepID=UPI001FE02F15|nr:hypothetical protein [Nonomuraea candida]
MRARLAAAVTLAPLLQVAMMERLPIPPPDLVLLVAVVAGAALGPLAGAVTGFAAGLVADLVPPALPPAGRTALLLCLAGYAAGLIPRSPARELPTTARALVASAGGTVLVTAAALLLAAWPGTPAPASWTGGATPVAGLPPAAAALAALPCNLIAGPLLWRLLTRRPRASLRRHNHATLPLPPAAGAPAGGSDLPHPARPVVAGADPGRRALRPSRLRRPRAPHRHPGRARAHPR